MAKRKGSAVLNKHVGFRLSAEEHFKLVDKAQRSGMNVGDFVRARVLNARKRKAKEMEVAVAAEFLALSSVVTELRKIGVNVNQIAKHCNTFQMPPPAELNPLLGELRTLLNRAWSGARG